MTFLRELSKAAKLGALATLVVAGGAIGGVVATSGGPSKPARSVVVQRSSTDAPTTTAPALPAPTTTTTAPAPPASTGAGSVGVTGPTAPPATTTTTTAVPTTTTVPMRRPAVFAKDGHGCMPGTHIGVAGLSGTPAPTGTLTISGTGMSATIPAAGGQPLCATAPPATYTETVTYAGDANWLPGSWTFALVMNPLPGG